MVMVLVTFTDSKLQWHKRTEGKYRIMLDWYRTLIDLRRSLPALRNVSKNDVRVTVLGQSGFVLHRQTIDGQQQVSCLFNLSDEPIVFEMPIWVSSWEKIVDSKDTMWQEDGTAQRGQLATQLEPGKTVKLPPCCRFQWVTNNRLGLGISH